MDRGPLPPHPVGRLGRLTAPRREVEDHRGRADAALQVLEQGGLHALRRGVHVALSDRPPARVGGGGLGPADEGGVPWQTRARRRVRLGVQRRHREVVVGPPGELGEGPALQGGLRGPGPVRRASGREVGRQREVVVAHGPGITRAARARERPGAAAGRRSPRLARGGAVVRPPGPAPGRRRPPAAQRGRLEAGLVAAPAALDRAGPPIRATGRSTPRSWPTASPAALRRARGGWARGPRTRRSTGRSRPRARGRSRSGPGSWRPPRP